MTNHVGVNGHQIDRDSGPYIHCVIVPVFAITRTYPFETIGKVSLSVHDLH